MNLTVGELKKILNLYPDDMRLDFSGLDFYRIKQRSDKLLQVEFNQLVYKNEENNQVIIENLD
ncbi:hypothetical protein NBRC116188_11740 [Oceaniserpentilla sp. 4NH20-0058]|uniref:hypothetical protein n=1 Tax=Oceaniserpentilla sp. 4NH20-0058 TaxID=3127660 RepID=UPI0031066135